jgi:pteridine reductase
MDLIQKKVLVTGGSVRLGRAIALGLAKEGADVAITYTRSREKAESTAALMQSSGKHPLLIRSDFSQNPADMAPVIDRVLQVYGHIDVLVNNAAIFESGNWDDTTEENWDRHFSINLKAPFFLSQAFAKAIPADRRAQIVNIADWRGVRPGTDHIAYTLSKAALIAMTKSLALALAPNIQVNAIAPGMILPPPGKDLAYLERMASGIPVKRIGSPEDIVRTVLYLLQSDFVSGQLIYVTGGEHL